jgi:hypothetical protein
MLFCIGYINQEAIQGKLTDYITEANNLNCLLLHLGKLQLNLF